jgi:Bacterial HORMA domain family 1
MSFSMTRAAVESFTLTQAKYLASKVTADMRRCQQLYGEPDDARINNLGSELALLLRDGYVKSYEFGFIRDADYERILTWKYSVDSSGNLVSDDRPGRIVSGVNVSGTTLRTYLIKSSAWDALSSAQKAAIEATLPITRKDAPEYKSSLGVWQCDLTYSASGVALTRQTFKLYGT